MRRAINRRELKRFKFSFTGHSINTIKEETAPVFLSKFSNYLIDSGKVNSILYFIII